MSSMEYQENIEAGNEEHYIVKMVKDMQEHAPGLQKYEILKQQYKEQLLRLTELEYIYKATVEDLERLRLSERFLLDDSFDGGAAKHNPVSRVRTYS